MRRIRTVTDWLTDCREIPYCFLNRYWRPTVHYESFTVFYIDFIILSVVSTEYQYPCEQLASGPGFDSSLNWGSEKSEKELV